MRYSRLRLRTTIDRLTAFYDVFLEEASSRQAFTSSSGGAGRENDSCM